MSARETQELFSGVLHKVGGKVKSWNRRFFILRSDYCLYYYKDTSKGPLGTITLRDPKFAARRGKASDISWPKQTQLECTMAIVTSNRTYCFYCSYSHEIEEWIRMLTKAREKMLAQVISGNSNSQAQNPLHNYEAVDDLPHKHNEVSEPVESLYALASSIEPVEPQDMYEDMLPTTTTSELYEEVAPVDETTIDHNHIPSGQASSQPLYDDITTEGIDHDHHEPSQPLYDDIPTEAVEQPLYEDIQPHHDEKTQQYIQESHLSGSEDECPSLPPRTEDTPTLPPRVRTEDMPTLPPRVSPPLPPKDDDQMDEKSPQDPLQDDKEPLELIPPSPRTHPVIPPSPRTHPQTPPSPRTHPQTPPSHTHPQTPPSPRIHPETPPSPCTRHETPPSPCTHPETPPSPCTRHEAPPSPHTCHEAPPSTRTHPETPPSPRIRPETPPSPCTHPETPPSPRSHPETPPSPRSHPETPPSPRSHPETPHTHSETPPSLRIDPDHKKPSHTSQQATTQDQGTRPVAKPRNNNRLGEDQPAREQGMLLFQSQKQRMDDSGEVKKRSETIRILEDVTTDPELSPAKKAEFAETLRSVEQERLLASEERFKWERERKNLEEERKKFEEEKKKLQEELEQTRLHMQQQF